MCVWRQDDDGLTDIACGQIFTITEKYSRLVECPYCYEDIEWSNKKIHSTEKSE